MKKFLLFVTLLAAITALAQVRNVSPVTPAMLLNPSPDDWLMYSRTYDAQRYSPLNQINKANVSRLAQVWTKPLATGTIEVIPIVHAGVMYVPVPTQVDGMGRTAVQALDATNGNLIWEYIRPDGGPSRSKTLGIFEDLIIYGAPDNYIVALDAGTGKVRWETQSTGGLSSGTIIFGDKVLTGRTCNGQRANCYIAAHDARTGKEVWRFYTAAGSDDPTGDASWGGAPEAGRTTSTWGLGGSYDPVRKTVYWGVANPTPNTRAARHGGNIDAIPRTAPADLYSNSTVAIDADTGKLRWYFQHLPGDDWDQDYTNERILLHTRVSPDPKFVKWLNPDIPKGQERDVVMNVGEGGGIFALDRTTGQFLWANPFPYDDPNFLISNIDGKTGKTTINWDVVLKQPGEHHVICAYNTKSYWPMSYHPGKNSLYIPYADDCLDMTRAIGTPGPRGAPPAPGNVPERRFGTRRPGSDPEKFGGLAKVNVATGEITRLYEGPAPGNGATLSTAGDLVFWGDLNQKFRAFDADNGKILWEATLGGPIQNSTITYRVNGKQYVAVITGLGGLTQSLFNRSGANGINPQRNNAIHVFALP
ncbi:MAG TPA: PQQ-binding-like beta-propeller repeat protein [Terriglobia bacterium]|nr:PQQ-binding-like beta-propeller repeat protein [Terriglobia bacterium]